LNHASKLKNVVLTFNIQHNQISNVNSDMFFCNCIGFIHRQILTTESCYVRRFMSHCHLLLCWVCLRSVFIITFGFQTRHNNLNLTLSLKIAVLCAVKFVFLLWLKFFSRLCGDFFQKILLGLKILCIRQTCLISVELQRSLLCYHYI